MDDVTYRQIDKLLSPVLRANLNNRAALVAKICNCGFTRDELDSWKYTKIIMLQAECDKLRASISK